MEKESTYQGEQVFQELDQMPEYPGGSAELFKFLMKNIKYPKAAREARIEGLVVLSFVVSKTGDIVDVKLLRSSGTAPVERMRDGKSTKDVLKWIDNEEVHVELTGGNLENLVTDTKPIIATVPLLKAEAVRVVESMPKWQAGRANGKAVNAQYQLPIRFDLSK